MASVLLAEGYIVYEISNMMRVEPQVVVDLDPPDFDNDVDESIDEDMYYKTIWREENDTPKDAK